MHFLRKLIESPELDDPAKKHKNIHRHFARYSKGIFIGPAIKITKTNTKITLKGSFEYEDLIQEIITTTISDKEFEINGVLITGSDITEYISNLGLDWNLKKSTGKTINYKAEINDKIHKNNLIDIIEKLRETSYLLLSFNLNPTCKVSTKKRIPQPSKKKVEEDDINKRIQFCTGVINNSERNIKLILDLVLKDFKSDLPEKWKTITITNNYNITNVIIPKNIQNSRLLRIMALRKGKMTRILDVDGELIEKQYSITV
ncbi:MAG: hypothetical protein EU529_13095 [Promethearchaeota archaeon]|nr:MAG: hypothetical protein EU529_13095 [Candidatus Lokiarchaeota archaeon]